MLNYGLRVGELMLLTIGSIKKSIQNQNFNLIITNTDDDFDNRLKKPKIKNEYSYRVIKLQKRDYKYIKIYIDNIRKETASQILFTSLQPPYSALSYAGVKKIFDKIDFKLRELLPECFEASNYDSIERLTPHVCRHSWAYMMLNYSFEKYKKVNIDYSSSASPLTQDALTKAQEDLRSMGGWSPTSTMPIHYGKRFIVERANFMNLARIIDTCIANDYEKNTAT